MLPDPSNPRTLRTTELLWPHGLKDKRTPAGLVSRGNLQTLQVLYVTCFPRTRHTVDSPWSLVPGSCSLSWSGPGRKPIDRASAWEEAGYVEAVTTAVTVEHGDSDPCDWLRSNTGARMRDAPGRGRSGGACDDWRVCEHEQPARLRHQRSPASSGVTCP